MIYENLEALRGIRADPRALEGPDIDITEAIWGLGKATGHIGGVATGVSLGGSVRRRDKVPSLQGLFDYKLGIWHAAVLAIFCILVIYFCVKYAFYNL